MIFIIGCVAYVVPAIVFIIFGSGNIQKWNEIPTTTKGAESLEKIEKQESANMTDIKS